MIAIITGTAGGPGGGDRTLAVKSRKNVKILGEKLFRTWEILRSGSKAKNGEKKERKRERKKERLNDGDNNGQATHCNATSCGARKAAWAN